MVGRDSVVYLDIQRLSTEDGPGLRTTVFFKGCPLRCQWCHNPESLSFKPEIVCLEDRCIGCGICETVCHLNARKKTDVDRTVCDACGRCAAACPTAAIEVKGSLMTVEKLVHELIRDRAYWGAEGGVTLSGGEAAAQKGAVELLRLLQSEGIHTALDTCGMTAWETLKRVLPHTNLFLYDLKLSDAIAHRRLTGADNKLIFDNARRLYQRGAKLLIRTPIIPGATDSETNIRGIGAFIAENLPNAEGWELCAFNNLCRDKYRRLGLPFHFADVPLMAHDEMDRLRGIAAGYLPNTIWTGATKS